MDKNAVTISINAIHHNDDQVQDDDEEHFNTARVNADQKYKPRTAVLSQQNLGFQ
jgi:hypothetical protein